MAANTVSIKQVLTSYKRNFNEKEIWSLLLASYQVYYKNIEDGYYHDSMNLDISSDNVYLEEDGEVLLVFSNERDDNNLNTSDKNHERKFAYALGCFLSYLIKLNDKLIDMSDELRTLIAYMVDEANDCTFTYVFEEAYRCSCMYLNGPYQKFIKRLYENTIKSLKTKAYQVASNLGDIQSENLFYMKGISKSKTSLKDIESSSFASTESQSRNINTLIEKIKKRKVKLKLLRSKLDFSTRNKINSNKYTDSFNAILTDSDDDDENSELDDLNAIITQSKQVFNEQSSNTLKTMKTSNTNEMIASGTQSSFFNQSHHALKSFNGAGRKFYDIRRIPPLLRFDDPLKKTSKDCASVIIKLITESKFEFKCSLQSTCKQLFDYVIAYLDLNEQNLFGLFIFYDDEYFHIDFDEKLGKLLAKWKRKEMTVELYFKIKIYMYDTNVLNDPLTLQFYYWELRRQFTNGYFNDMNDDQLSNSDDLPNIFQLAILAFHAEGGELNELNYLYNNYIPEKYMTEVSLFEIQICELFKMIQDNQTSYQSLVQFTTFIIGHKNYGYHFYRYKTDNIVTRNNSLNSTFMDYQNYLGLSLYGITVFKNLFNTMNKEEKSLIYTWDQVEKLSVEKKKIFIELRSIRNKNNVYYTQQKPNGKQTRSSSVQNKVWLNVNSEKKSKAILNLSKLLLRHYDAIQQRQTSKISNFQATMFETYSNSDYELSGGFTNSIVVDDNELNKIINLNNTEQSAPPPPQLYSNRSNDTKKNPEKDNPKWDVDKQTITGDYLLKEYFTNEKYLAYIKTITLDKIKNQALGILIDEDADFKYKFIKRIYHKNGMNEKFEIGDIILSINNSIKFNDMKSTQLEMYLNNYNGRLHVAILSKDNLNQLLNEYQKQNVQDIVDQQDHAVMASSIGEERFVNFTSFGQDTTNRVAPYKTRELNYDILSVLWQDFNKKKIFNTSLVKSDKNELGFTIKKLNNGFSCVKEISCDPVKQKLSVGDIIIKINDMPTNFLSHHDIVALIKSSSNIVRLEMYRPSGSDSTAVSDDPIVPELLLNSKFDTSDECNETGGVDEDDEKTIVANTILEGKVTKKYEQKKIDPLQTMPNNKTSNIIELEYGLKEFLELNLILSMDNVDGESDENDEESFLNSLSQFGKLYVKSIDTSRCDATKRLQMNDVILKLNNNSVRNFDEFKLCLFNLNKSNQSREDQEPVRLLVERTDPNSNQRDLRISTARDAHSLTLKDINYKNYTSFNSSISSVIPMKPDEIENFNSWFLSPKYTQFFFPQYTKQTQVLSEEYLLFYSNFRNINADKLKQLISMIENKIHKTQGYMAEFKQFKTTISDIDSSKIANYNQENRSKNRYRNVVPFDYNRVKLIDKQNNDYINASHVCLPLNIFKEKELYELHYIAKFIVAQPPLNSTINDFLQMIWEQNINTIVKLLANDEIDRIKCPTYWPTDQDKTKDFLPFFQLLHISTNPFAQHTNIIRFFLTNLKTNEKRELVICQYTDEFNTLGPGVQVHSDNKESQKKFNDLQTFSNLVHVYHQSGPLLVYCGNGIGQTGVFLCIYYNLILFKCDFNANAGYDNMNFVHDTTKLLRTQRNGLIQTKQQYRFCYSFFLSLFQNKLDALAKQNSTAITK